MFFSDDAGFGIELVQSLDAAHAQHIARAQHPTGRLQVTPADLLDCQDRHKLLRAWLSEGKNPEAHPAVVLRPADDCHCSLHQFELGGGEAEDFRFRLAPWG